ncbi:hypothetical protein [Longimicrobium sp.]|uniref:hypothetical protein n=1 Tax=Longimicrobium sp. TaxID=2029185 RepID=UPI002E31484C|nr:hypothetical protein [Longimicrobium sp.]HEX6041058.1 hypothetical protein [Longimicrobium sp.]
MRTLTGLLLLMLAMLLGLVEAIALADPVGTRMANDAAPFGPAEPWYVHAAWIAVICLMTGVAARLLDGGIVGRLVRGRGLTPAPRRP